MERLVSTQEPNSFLSLQKGSPSQKKGRHARLECSSGKYHLRVSETTFACICDHTEIQVMKTSDSEAYVTVNLFCFAVHCWSKWIMSDRKKKEEKYNKNSLS